jgi:hypothetical protein
MSSSDIPGVNVLVEVTNAATVNINNVTVEGLGAQPSPAVNNLIGVGVFGGATANLTGDTINNVNLGPASFGLQTGIGILVGGTLGTAFGQVGHATITDCTVTDYQKGGIVIGRNGSTGDITGSTITGVGPSAIGQNGIQISPGAASATVSNNTISGNEFTGSTSDPTDINQGAGILNFIGSSSIAGNRIFGNDQGIFSQGGAISDNTIQNNRFEGILAQGNATVSNNTIAGSNIGVAVLGFVNDQFGNPVTQNAVGNLIGNNITNNGNTPVGFPGAGILVENESGATFTAELTAHFNRIVGNSVGLDNNTAATGDATNNWWGSNAGPGGPGSDTVSGPVTFNPWLVLQVTASPAAVVPGGVATVVASLTTNSSGMDTSALGHVPDGIPVFFAATLGSISPTASATVSGKAVATFTAGALSGMATVFATVDNRTSSAPITIASLQVFLYQGPVSPRNTALDFIISDPTPRPHTLWIFWGDSNQPEIIPLGVGAGTFFFQATHRYSIKSFRQHRHRPYTVTTFVLAGSAPSQTLLAGSILVFRPADGGQRLQRGAAGSVLAVQYFPLGVASYVNG